jgi:hypothetical protein
MQPKAKSGAARKRFQRAASLTLVLVLLSLAFAMVNNNVSIRRPSRALFLANLDDAVARSADWALRETRQPAGEDPAPANRDLLSNVATAYMVVECASLSTDLRMQALGTSFLDAWKERRSFLGKMIDPAIPANTASARDLEALDEYQRWILHGAAPDDFPLAAAELADMFSPDKYRTGKATHQLFALTLYRKSRGSTPELERVMRQIEQRIAGEAALDFRVTDLYLQRLAILLAAGRPDLVRPRWVERALAAQQSDGGWLKTWHGWDRTPYRFSFGQESTSAHPTAQGMWIAHMLKFRYPGWIQQNYE